MNIPSLKILPVTVAASLLATAAMAQAVSAPRLAPGVKAQAGYEASTDKLVIANPTPIFSDIRFTASQTGHLDKIGEPVTVLAKVKDWAWVLVGKDGQGVGYVPIDLLKPASGRASKS